MNTERLNNIIAEINNGGNWNGKFYTDRKGKITIYVDGNVRLVGEVKWGGEEAKEYILNRVKKTDEKPMTYGEAYEMHGFDFAEEGESKWN